MNSSKLSIFSFYVQGFDNSLNYVQYLLKTVDIMFIQELWLLSCNLSHIYDLNNDFVVYSKSSMDLKCSNGLLVGRPYGGVAVLWSKRLGNRMPFCCNDNDGRIICIKMCTAKCKFLISGCYFPS